jgi:SAM-dependent methyltransferase
VPKRYSVGERAVRLPRNGSETRGAAYLDHPRDAVRETFETAFFARELDRLLKETGARRVVDLGCGDGLLGRLVARRLDEYLGVDVNPPARDLPRGRFLRHDLREGLGPVGDRPFDLYVGSFGIASHFMPAALERLLKQIAAHGRIGSMVAIEALGLYSLEWPCIWDAPPGSARTLYYRLARETKVHPWSAPELAAVMEGAGITPLRALDRSVQAGPKVGTGDYWHGLPAVRTASTACSSATAHCSPRWLHLCLPYRLIRPHLFTALSTPAGGSGWRNVPRVSHRRRLREAYGSWNPPPVEGSGTDCS